MADNFNPTTAVLSVIATTSKRLSDLLIKDGQMIFIQDRNRIALDWGGKRKFYNSIEVLEAEAQRKALEAPVSGYYFVIDTAVLWRYEDGWVQVTSQPEEIVFVGVEMPELGVPNKLYVNKHEQNISVWDEETDKFIEVADTTGCVTIEQIDGLF